jgi:hypothetical protein
MYFCHNILHTVHNKPTKWISVWCCYDHVPCDHNRRCPPLGLLNRCTNSHNRVSHWSSIHISAAICHNMFHVCSTQIHSHPQFIYRSLCSINLPSWPYPSCLFHSYYLSNLLASTFNFSCPLIVVSLSCCCAHTFIAASPTCFKNLYILFCNAWCIVFRFSCDACTDWLPMLEGALQGWSRREVWRFG